MMGLVSLSSSSSYHMRRAEESSRLVVVRAEPRASGVRSCGRVGTKGCRAGDGKAEDAVEREGEEASRAWHSSEQYIRLGGT